MQVGSGRSGGIVKWGGGGSAAGGEGGEAVELERGIKAWRWDDVGMGD